MSPARFRALCLELMDENPFAIRAVLKVLKIEFTESVPTLAVTLEARPRMLVNLGFVARCATEAEAKALVCHEFLHVLLRHTEHLASLDAAGHVALDAVINALIHRQLGSSYSAMMSGYYARETGITRLLRPPADGEECKTDPTLPPAENQLRRAWTALYDGLLVADDIAGLARDLRDQSPAVAGNLLGSHEDVGDTPDGGQPLPEVLQAALERSLKGINRHTVWRSSTPGADETPYLARTEQRGTGQARWQHETFAVLQRHLLPDPRAAPPGTRPDALTLPVLSPGDRRAVMRALWSPFLPDATWQGDRRSPHGRAQVYLDVSASMDEEMPLIVGLLARLAGYIRRPFWAFSTVVVPARIKGGRLLSRSSGGTSLRCVLEHLARTRPAMAVIITDGYVEALAPGDLEIARATRLHAIVTHDGDTGPLRAAGIRCTQLSRLPAKTRAGTDA